ncbi:MAG: hypothetical protein QM709_08225 [Spongiibacteraceae bacterium]
MNTFTNRSILSIYSAPDSLPTRESLLHIIEHESQSKYPHLHVRFHPNRYMQAKINVDTKTGLLQKGASRKLAEILKSEKFFLEEFSHHLPQCDSKLDAPQYVLINKELERIGYQFVMKASIGSSFISFWFRNESDSPRMDLPVFYALEILNKLHDKIQGANLLRQTDTREILRGEAAAKKSCQSERKSYTSRASSTLQL